MKPALLYLVFSLCSIASALSQRGIVSGTILASDDFPLPGVNVFIEGSSEGTQTDFDGNYSIACAVGDTLVFTYIGMQNRKVKVTASMFTGKPIVNYHNHMEVKPKFSDDYEKSLLQSDSLDFEVPAIDNTTLTFKKSKKYFDTHRIKAIALEEDKVNVKFYSKEIRFDLDIDNNLGFRFIRERNLPSIQNQFAQGSNQNGNLSWFGPETGIPFSYGPKIENLEFNGQSYPFDFNGQLVPLGSGNGDGARHYDEPLFKTAYFKALTSNFRVFWDYAQLNLKISHENQADIFNQGSTKQTSIALDVKESDSYVDWDASVSYDTQHSDNANLNALHNQILFSHLVTPPSFSNGQGFQFDNGVQRSFSPNRFNNPNWLLQRNSNTYEESNFSSNLGASYEFKGNHTIAASAIYLKQERNDFFQLPALSNGFTSGFETSKQWNSSLFDVNVYNENDLNDLIFDTTIVTETNIKFRDHRLNYHRRESNEITELLVVDNRLQQSTWQIDNAISIELWNLKDLKLTFQNSSFLSNLQGNKWFLPSFKFFFLEHFGSSILHYSSISAGYSKSVSDIPLFYGNNSHNSLGLQGEGFLGYTTNNDLFNSKGIGFEEIEQFDIEAKLHLLNNRLQISANYFRSSTTNRIFPIFRNNSWQLENVANTKNEGLEASIQYDINRYGTSAFEMSTQLTFFYNRPKVIKILDDGNDRIPIAGFQDISKNLIPGQAAGVLVGTAFLRDVDGNQVIGNDGFPLVDPDLQILGNPNPDFGLGWSNQLSLSRFALNFVFEYQKGGEVWNGTQNTLNYFGSSQESANLRNTSNFIFPGVDLDGNRNTTLVSFTGNDIDTARNRWVRYGFSGVAEEAISDGTYLNLKSVSLEYTITAENKSSLFKKLRFGVYANNLFTWTKTEGVNPYSALFGNSSATGLHFFNLPLVSEIGFNLNINI